jgi:hypothetical protein
MNLLFWLPLHWIDLIQTSALVAGFLTVRSALMGDARARQIGNSITLSQHHRDLWERLLADPQLARILDSNADTRKQPVTFGEEMFVIFVIIHLSDSYTAIQTGFYERLSGLRKDIQNFFSLPVPQFVWNKVKDLQELEFLKFVENCLHEQSRGE